MSTAPTIDIGILTIRDDEFKAVLEVFPDNHSIFRGRHREYTLRTAHTAGGFAYRLAILRQVEQGNGEAQEAARDMVDDLQPSLLLLVGIAGGLPSDDFTLGDVVLSTRIVDFSIEARRFEEPATYNSGGGPISKAIATGVANLSAREAELGTWTSALPAKPPVSWSGKKQLYGPAKWKKELKEKLEAHYGLAAKPRAPLFVAGSIASSDRLVKDPTVLFPWVTTARSLLAVEMESAGVHRATRDRTPMLAIRGLSDIVGLKRHDAWTKYACASAAAFTKAYLRTKPVEIKKPPDATGRTGDLVVVGPPATQSPVATPAATQEECFANLLPLRQFPEKLYVGSATCKSIKDGWRLLRSGRGAKEQYIPGAWILHEGNLYSLVDPEHSRLKQIVDIGSIEAHVTQEWGFSKDGEQRRLFVSLMNSALRDDLWSHGVRYHSDSDVFACSGFPDEPPRKYNYQNLKQRSTMTIVSHYEGTSKTGKKYKYLRHVAFGPRFRFLGDSWHLEITPTYRFTRDGKAQDIFHESRLSKIKRLERNRSVLSQLLFWQALLRAPWARADRPRLLEFGALQRFAFSQAFDDSEFTPLDSVPAVLQVFDKEIGA